MSSKFILPPAFWGKERKKTKQKKGNFARQSERGLRSAAPRPARAHRERVRMVSRRAAPAGASGGGKLRAYARNIGKAFVRPGAIARYVDAQKVSKSNLAVLQVAQGSRSRALEKKQTRPHDHVMPVERKGKGKNSKNSTSSRWQATSAPPKVPKVDITLKGKSGKRVRTYLSDEQIRLKYATVPTPRGIAPRDQKHAKRQRREMSGAAGPSFSSRREGRIPLSPRLASLPSDILTRVFCCMRHQDMKPLLSVCTRLADAAKTAITTHFNFLTPDPKRATHYVKDQAVATTSRHAGDASGSGRDASRAFGSASQPVPQAPRQKRRSRRLSQRRRRPGTKMIKKRSLVFDDDATTTSGSTGSCASDTGSGSGMGAGKASF